MPTIFKTAGVYRVTNLLNGKFYVGSSQDIETRWRTHRYYFKMEIPKTRSYLHNAVRKYGVENFSFEILEECEPIKDVLLEREQHYIDALKPEYNILPIAGSRLGSKAPPETIEKLRQLTHTEEWKQRASVWASAYMSDPDVKAYYSALRAGKTFEEIFGEERAVEILAKQSENRTGKHVGFDPWNKGIPMTDEQRELLFAGRDAWIENGGEPWNKGVPMSAELREKLEASGFWEMTDEKRRHNSEAHLGQEPWNKGQTMDEEYCQTASEAAKARFDPDHQALMTERAREVNTGVARSEDTKAKISASNLASEARKAYVESVTGVSRPKEVGEKVSASLQRSEKAKAYHEGRIGKSRGNNPSGQYGVIWDKSRNKWQVRVVGKSYGRSDRLEDAVAKAQEVLAMFEADSIAS